MMSKAWIAGIFVVGCGPLPSCPLIKSDNYTALNEHNLTGGEQEFEQNSAGQSVMIKEPDIRTDLILLSGDEIHSIISGKTIFPDFTVQQASLDFSEQFLPDGNWISLRKMRGAVQIEGHWHVKDNKICVEKINGKAECRNVWKSRSSGHLYISDLGSSPPFNKTIRIIVK